MFWPDTCCLAANWNSLSVWGSNRCVSTFRLGDFTDGMNSVQNESHSGFLTHERGSPVSLVRDKDSKSHERALSRGYDATDKSHLSEWNGGNGGSTTKSDVREQR